MSIHSRIFRSYASADDSNRPESFGGARFGNAGDEAAAARAGLDVVLRRAEAPAATVAGIPLEPGPDLQVASTLSFGQIAIVGYNAEDTSNPDKDTISFLLLAPIGSGTQIFFTDKAWNGSAFAGDSADEDTFVYTAGADLPAGTVVHITTAQLNGVGIDLVDTGETIYAYQGALNAPTTFLFAADIADNNTTFNGNLTGTGLSVAANSAVAVAQDNASWAGRGHNHNMIPLLDSIADFNDWVGNDNSMQVAHTGSFANAPDQQIWVAASGGGEALVRLSRDGASFTAEDIVHILQNTSNNGNGTTNTFRVFHPTDITFDTVGNKVFVADSNGTGENRILQYNISDFLDNPGVPPQATILYRDTTVGIGIISLQVDIANDLVYFAIGTQLLRIDYNTAAQTPEIVSDLGVNVFVQDFVIDLNGSGNGTAYLTNSGIQSVFGSDNINRNFLYSVAGITPTATGLAAVQMEIDQNDTEVTGVVNPNADPQAFPEEYGALRGIHIDPDTKILYFTTYSVSMDHDGNSGTPPQTQQGGVWSYATISNPTGVLSSVWRQDGVTASDGLLRYVEVDTVNNKYYISDVTGGPGVAADDQEVWVGNLAGGAPTLFANVANIQGLGPQAINIQNAPTLTGNSLVAAVTEASNLPASGVTGNALLYSSLAASDLDTAGGDELLGALVRISGNFQQGATHLDQLRITNNLSGTIAGSGITYSYDATTGHMTLSGAATVAEYAAALNLVTFNTGGDNVTNYVHPLSTRTVSVSVFDGLLYSDEIHTNVTVTGINDAPVNTPGAAMSFTEDTIGHVGAEGVPPTPVSNAVTGISVFDVDADPATQDITVTLAVGVGTLTIRTDVAGGIQPADVISGNGTGTIVITATQNQINTTLAAMSPAFTGPPVVAAAPNGLIYTPPANYNGATNLTITTNDNGFNGNDPGISGTGTSEQDQDVKVLNLAHVNDAPTVTDATQAAATILEDVPSAAGETVTSLFNASFSDALDQQQTGGNPTGSVANTLAGIAVVANGSSGATGQWQYFNGTIWVDIGAASLASAQLILAGTAIRFTPALNFNGAAPTLTVHLVDSSGGPFLNGDDVNLSAVGATGGTTRYSAGTVVLSQDITPVNDAPTSANVAGDTATYTEQQALAALLDTGSNATVADVDSPNFDTGTLTVAISAGLVAAEDQLVIRTVGTVTFTANTVSVGGIQIATYVGGGAGGGNLVFTFNAMATPAAVAELIRAIAYNNSAGDDPTDGNRTITWTLVDGDGTANTGVDTVQFTTTLDVDPVNDAPQGADETIVLNEDGTHVLNAGNFNFTDPLDGDAFAGVVLTTLPASGDLYLNNVAITVAGTFVTIADINGGLLTYKPDPNGNGIGYATFTFQVRDNGGILDGGVDTDPNPDTITFDVTAVNDAPVQTAPAAASVNEDGTLVFSTANGNAISVADIDAGGADLTTTVTIADGALSVGAVMAGLAVTGEGTNSLTLVGTLAEINDALQGLSYAPPANANGPRTLTVTTNDGGATGTDPGLTGDGTSEQDSDQIAITINSVNDAPAGADKTVTASEDDPYVFLTTDFGFTDPIDGDDFAGIVLTTLPVEGDLRLNGVNITVAGTFITAADIAAGLLTFLADPDESGDNYASFDFQVRDDGGILFGGQDTDQSAETITIDVEPDNIAPTLDLDGDDSNTVGTGYTASFTEGGAAVLITDTDVAIVDPDVGGTIEGATITINGAVAGDQLILADQAAPFVVTGSGTGTITITGTGTAAQYEAMLEQITFSNTSDDPGTTRTINVTVTDGVATSNIAVATINIAEINDEPTLAATAVNPTFTEGGAAADLFSGVTADTIEAGQTFVSLTLTVTNVTDGADEILVVGGMNVALTNGNVVATPAGNVTVTLAAGTATVVVGPSTLSEAALQTLIDGLAYLNTSENPTDADRVVTITQLVDSGSDTSPNDATLAPNIASTVNVNPINDTPLNTVPGTQTINEDASVTLSTGNGNAIQVADADATTLTVTLTVLHGTLTLASTAGLSFGGGDGTADTTMTFSGTAAAINAALGSGLTYNPNADFNGSDSIAVFTTDNGQSGGPAQTDSDSVTINITAINDAPVVIGSGTESATTIDEDTPGAGQTIHALFSGQYSDAADNQVPNGGASSPGQFSGIAVTANGSSAATGQWQYFSGGVWTDIGAVSDAAAKLLGDPFVTLIRFNPAADFNGPAPTLTVHLIDNSLGFGIVNGQVVDLSGPGATGGTTAYSTGTVVLSQSVTAVNDGPLNTVPGAQTINEDASFTLSTGNGNAIQVADADATTLTVTLTVLNGTLTLASTAGLSFSGGSDGTADVTMTFSGTATAINAALGSGLTYNPNGNYNGPDSIAVLTSDNGQTGNGGTLQDNDSIAITVNPVNDAPSSTGGSVTGSEDDPYVFTAADFNFSDPVEGHSFFAVQITTLPAAGDILLNGAPVLAGDFIAVSAINAGMLTFQPDPDGFGAPYTTFTFRVQDGGGVLNGGVDTDPTPRTMTITVTPDNLAPEVDLNGVGAGIDAAVSYTEDAPGVSIGSGITVSDPNEVTGDLIESATIILTDAVAGDALTVTLPLPGGITAVTTNPAGQIMVTLSGPASTADYAAAIAQVLYSTSNQDPTLGGTDPTRTITVTVNDGMLPSAVATSTVTITPLDDAAVAFPDLFTTDEATAIVAGNVFAANPSNPDFDPDGPPLQVGAVNGMAVVGSQITLASGALLMLNANGTFSYNPNGAFNTLPDFVASGASNTTAPDSFTYTLVNGNTVMVSLTIRGVDSNGDILLGTPGVDSLDGGIGADTMTGFAGNDTYFIDNAGDVVVEVAGEGSDTIRTGVSYTLGAALDVETLTTTSQVGTGAIDLAGNGLNNRIEGNDGVNLLAGNGGLDRLFGFGGDDILNGGAGNDEIDGGAGIDRALYAGGIGFADTLVGWVVVSAEGSDLLERVEIAVAGSGQRNLLVGSTAFGTIQAASNAAGMGDNIRLAAGSYAETVGYSASGLRVFAQTGAVQNVTYVPTADIGISVYGANLADTITTGAGADTLSGGGGIDHLSGGGGNDIYHVGEAGDVVIELVGGGADIIYSAVSYALSDSWDVEALATLSFEGTASINLTGNSLNNYLIGNDGDNQLNGRGGDDVMVGRGGGDIYLVYDTGDQVFEDANGGYDVIYTSESYTLTNDQEIEGLSTITWESTIGIDLTGNGSGNYLIGNAGVNELDGKGGNDVLQGKEGVDKFAFTTALGAGNVDTIFDFDFGGAEDTIDLAQAVFAVLAPGVLNSDAFALKSAPGEVNDRIIYDNVTGELFYDEDGSATFHSAILFAVVQNAPALNANDFFVSI